MGEEIRGYRGLWPIGYDVSYGKGSANTDCAQYAKELAAVKVKGLGSLPPNLINALSDFYEKQYIEIISIQKFCDILDNLTEPIHLVGDNIDIPAQFFELAEQATSKSNIFLFIDIISHTMCYIMICVPFLF